MCVIFICIFFIQYSLDITCLIGGSFEDFWWDSFILEKDIEYFWLLENWKQRLFYWNIWRLSFLVVIASILLLCHEWVFPWLFVAEHHKGLMFIHLVFYYWGIIYKVSDICSFWKIRQNLIFVAFIFGHLLFYLYPKSTQFPGSLFQQCGCLYYYTILKKEVFLINNLRKDNI